MNQTGSTSTVRVAMFLGIFPSISETFILRQITGLLEAGHAVDIYADERGSTEAPVHEAVRRHGLLDRATFMELPPETVPYEIPLFPLTDRTWPPGAAKSVANWRRLCRSVPAFVHCLALAPSLALSVVRPSCYGYRARSLSCLGRLDRLMARRHRHYDVLHAHFGPVGECFRFARELFRAPLVVSFHGYDFTTLPRREGPHLYRRLFQAADAVTANSHYTRTRLLELGCPEAKLHRLPMGVTLEEFLWHPRTRPSGQPLRLLTVARLVPIKGHATALRAVAQLNRTHGPLEYHLVGAGPLRKTLEQLAKELGLESQVHFHGARTTEQLQAHYRDNHLFILPSVSIEGDAEGQGLVLQEAQATGMPVVATRHGGLPEGMVPDQSGLVVEEGNAEALTGALAQLADHPERWEAMGRAGRDFVAAHYDAGMLRGRLVDLYQSVRQTYEANHE